MDKQQQILEMAKDICRVTHICNDVCNPISACDALRYAERAVEAGYIKVVRCKECKHSCFVKSCSKYECRKGCGTLKYSNDFAVMARGEPMMRKEKQIDEMVEIVSKCMTKWLNNETPKSFPNYIAEETYNAGYRKQEWISVDERLPEKNIWVLAFYHRVYKSGESFDMALVAKLNEEKFFVPFNCSPVRDKSITHWMPLPEAPKETDDKTTIKKDLYTPDEVRNMSMNEIRDNITAIRESMKRWRDE